MAVKNRKLMIVLTFSIVLTFGIITNLRSVLNPLIQRDLEITYAQLSFVVAFFATGTLIATFFSGALITRYSLKKVFIAALFLGFSSLFIIQYVRSFYFLLTIMIFMGLAMGMINVAGNSLASRVFTKNRGRMMNLFHFFFGLGGFLAPIYANYIMQLGMSWALVYAISSIFMILLLAGSYWQEFPKDEGKITSEANFWNLLQDRRVFSFAAMFLFSVGTELGIINWLGVYLKDVQYRSEAEVSFYLSLFFVFFTAGRLLVTLIVEKFSYLKIVIYGSSLAAISILLGIVGPDGFAFFFSLSGLFISINFPTMQAAMFEMFDKNLALIISITLTAGTLGDIFLGNNVIGVMGDMFGIDFAFSIFILYLIIMILITYNLENKLNRKKFNV